MSYEILPIPDDTLVEVTNDSGRLLAEAAEKKLDILPPVKALLQDIKTAHLPSYYHCLRVGEVASLLAEDKKTTNSLFIAGVLHDIGKSYPGIPKLLDDPGRLSSEQLHTINVHSEYGMSKIMRTLEELDSSSVGYQDLAGAAFVAYYHHVNLAELESLQTLLGSAILDTTEDELEHRKSLTHIVHLVDQVDARTDITRPYLFAEESRQNIGVQRSTQQLLVNPRALWSEVSQDFYGSGDNYDDNPLARELFAVRFGDQLVAAD